MHQPLIRESAGSTFSCGSRSSRSVELKKIKDQLISRIPRSLKVVTIVGMGGIGKTTFAKTIYEDNDISYSFHLRAWVSVSQEYKLGNLLLCLLRSLTSVPDDISELEDEELAHKLYKSLKGRRFLIVFDDMWNVETWNDFKWIIPDDNNGSRVILTSRLMEVARYVEPNRPPNYMNCLTSEESWMLLRNEVFADKPCPFDLVKFGQEIADKCQGLPLAIVVVAGHLSKIKRKQECWAEVAKKLDTIITGSNQGQILDILCLSYKYLPLHLKACFLYLGIFPKNSGIHIGKLIRLWTAVGFLHSEDEAEKCLEDLINRNLIMVRNKKCDRTAKTCGIHDLLWDLSFRETQKEGRYIFSQFNFEYSQFNSSTATTTNDLNHLIDLTFSSVYLGNSFRTLPHASICFRLLRVLDIQSERFGIFPETITNLVGLRYLELYTYDISVSVYKLCNLETLINRYKGWGTLLVPEEIWLLSCLRHLHAGKVTLETPITCIYDLQTLSTVRFDSCSELLFSKIPNLKQLKICDINGREDKKLSRFLNSLVYLDQLEKLNLNFSKEVTKIRQQQIPWCDFFPECVKQLTLSGSRLQWEDMNFLAKLPNIEVLKLKKYAFEGPIYEQKTLEVFRRLKVLLFEELELELWIAETIHYPVLQHLVLRGCFSLEEIPSCFGEITTLESIELVFCSKSAKESARTIQEEQQGLGNDLQLLIRGEFSGFRKLMTSKLRQWQKSRKINSLSRYL